MKKYSVLLIVDATVSVEVEAENEDEAKQKAFEDAEYSLCAYCSRSLDVGDIIEVAEIHEMKS